MQVLLQIIYSLRLYHKANVVEEIVVVLQNCLDFEVVALSCEESGSSDGGDHQDMMHRDRKVET